MEYGQAILPGRLALATAPHVELRASVEHRPESKLRSHQAGVTRSYSGRRRSGANPEKLEEFLAIARAGMVSLPGRENGHPHGRGHLLRFSVPAKPRHGAGA